MKTKRWLVAGLMVSGLLGLGLLGSNRWPGFDQAKDPSAEEGGGETNGAGFSFPADRGGKLLSQLLPPSEKEVGRPLVPASEPRRFPDLDSRKRPEAPLTPPQPELPRALALPPARPVRPRTLPEEAPLARTWSALAPPENPRLPASTGVRLPSPNPDQPAPVPVLAQPRSDRGFVNHPTADFSTTMALTAPLPERTRPVPFVRLVLADPFEHYQTVQLKTPPPEEQIPSAVTRLPGR
jgi:hypothetical protein